MTEHELQAFRQRRQDAGVLIVVLVAMVLIAWTSLVYAMGHRAGRIAEAVVIEGAHAAPAAVKTGGR